MTIEPRTDGYVDVNGVHMYYEVYGDGSPLVLLHGGVMTIELDFAALLPELVTRHTVIAVELQGHGRTADTGRAITPAALASDVVGHSLGGGVALELAVSHPDRVRSIVPMSITVRPDGTHEEITDPSKHATSSRMPTPQDFADMTEAYKRLSPHPEHFDDFVAMLSSVASQLEGWTDEQLAGVTAPTLLMIGDHDFTTVEHAALMLRLIPGSQLAVLPGTTHMTITRRPDLVIPML